MLQHFENHILILTLTLTLTLQHFENHIPVHALVARASELYFEDYPELRPDLDRPVRTATATSAGGGGPQRSTT